MDGTHKWVEVPLLICHLIVSNPGWAKSITSKCTSSATRSCYNASPLGDQVDSTMTRTPWSPSPCLNSAKCHTNYKSCKSLVWLNLFLTGDTEFKLLTFRMRSLCSTDLATAAGIGWERPVMTLSPHHSPLYSQCQPGLVPRPGHKP